MHKPKMILFTCLRWNCERQCSILFKIIHNPCFMTCKQILYEISSAMASLCIVLSSCIYTWVFFSHNSIKLTPETPAENNLCPGILHRFEGHFHCENIEQFQSEDIFCYLTSINMSRRIFGIIFLFTDPPQGRDRTSTRSRASASRLSPPQSPCGGHAAWREGSLRRGGR